LTAAVQNPGHFSDAAIQYRQVLKAVEAGMPDSAIARIFSASEGRLTARIYKSLAVSHKRAGALATAEETLKECAEKFPDETDVSLKLAEIQAKEAKFDAVAVTVRKAAEHSPGLKTRDVSNALLTELKAHFVDFTYIQDFLNEYWTPFRNLSTEAREKWTAGVLLNHFSPQRVQIPSLRREAAVLFATAVEQVVGSKYSPRSGSSFGQTLTCNCWPKQASRTKKLELSASS
jgi:hypothetical protein